MKIKLKQLAEWGVVRLPGNMLSGLGSEYNKGRAQGVTDIIRELNNLEINLTKLMERVDKNSLMKYMSKPYCGKEWKDLNTNTKGKLHHVLRAIIKELPNCLKEVV